MDSSSGGHLTPEYIAIGKIGAPRGLKGEVRIQLYNTQSQILKKTRFIYLKAGFSFQKKKVLSFNTQGKFFFMTLENYSSPEDIKTLQGEEIFVSRDQLPLKEKNEFYVHELIGMQVCDEQGEYIGEVRGIENYGSADILKVYSQVSENPKEYLIPWIPDLLVQVDEVGRKIIIRKMEGLL